LQDELVFVLLCDRNIQIPVLLRGHLAEQASDFMQHVSSVRMTIGSFEIQGSKFGGLYDFVIVIDHQGKLEMSTKVTNK
jgi:hypothetical protein